MAESVRTGGEEVGKVEGEVEGGVAGEAGEGVGLHGVLGFQN